MIPNISDRKARCPYCLDDSWVVVQTRPDGAGHADEMGPCPNCELGQKANDVQYDGGFWAGRQVPELERRDQKPERARDGAERVRQLVAHVVGEELIPL